MKTPTWRIAALVAVAALIATPAAAAPLTYPSRVMEGFPYTGSPEVSAPAWILYDASADAVLASRSPNEVRPMASITKIMTGLLVVENTRPDDMVTISAKAAATGEKEIELVAGEVIEMDALFKALMIHSANDAATAIAEHIAGSVGAFVELMNTRAAEFGMEGTSFANPHGLDAPNHYTTAADMLILTRVAMQSERFADVVRARIVVMPPSPDGSLRKGTTTNLMLDWYEGALGVKTGYTSEAQLTYVGVAERNERHIYVVLLGAEGERAHFSDAINLLDYAFDSLGYFGDVALGSPYSAAKARAGSDSVLVSRDVETYLHLAGQGLALETPSPLVSAPESTPPIIVELARHPETPPRSLIEIVSYWFTGIFGQ